MDSLSHTTLHGQRRPAPDLPHQGAKIQYGRVPIYTRGDDSNAKQFRSLHAVQVWVGFQAIFCSPATLFEVMRPQAACVQAHCKVDALMSRHAAQHSVPMSVFWVLCTTRVDSCPLLCIALWLRNNEVATWPSFEHAWPKTVPTVPQRNVLSSPDMWLP
eukprot:1137217-Pelagomonas_calceolata.AAC.2